MYMSQTGEFIPHHLIRYITVCVDTWGDAQHMLRFSKISIQ